MTEVIGFILLAGIVIPLIIWAENDFADQRDEQDRKSKGGLWKL